MDEVICAWHNELIQEEAQQALLSQDCFAGELTETVLSQKRLRQQAQHVIGPHVTGRLQLTVGRRLRGQVGRRALTRDGALRWVNLDIMT